MKLARDDKRARALVVRPRGTQRYFRPQRQQTQTLNQFAGGSRPALSIGSGSGTGRSGGGGAPGRFGGAGALATVAAALAQPFLPPLEPPPDIFQPVPITPFVPQGPVVGGDIPRPEGPAPIDYGSGDRGPTAQPVDYGSGARGPAPTPGVDLGGIAPGTSRGPAPAPQPVAVPYASDRQSQGLLDAPAALPGVDPAIMAALLQQRRLRQ